MSSSSRKESELLLLNSIKRLYTEYEHVEISTENIQTLSDKLYQIWMRPQLLLNVTNRNNEGYYIVDYLEQMIVETKMNERFFILLITVLIKNETFYHTLLNNHQRFRQLFNLSIRKPVYLMRYIELLYYYCPVNLISTAGLEFYRFLVDNYLIKYFHQTSYDIDWLAEFSILLYRFYENTTKTQLIFTNQNDAIDYSIYVINTFLHHYLKIKDLMYDLKLINTIIKTLTVVWEQNYPQENSSQDNITLVQIRSIEHLYDSMSNNKSLPVHSDTSKTRCSPAILAIFPLIQLDAADLTLKNMFVNGRLNGERLLIMVKNLIELINAPIQLIQNMAYETWVIGLCTAFTSFNQHEYLLKVLDETTPFLLDHLLSSQTSDNAYQILFWFIRYDKRIHTFRLLLDRLPNLFEQIKQINNDEIKSRIIELCHIGIAIHPEYNISNELILKEILHNLPQADLNILLNHKNIHAKLHSIQLENNNKIINRVGIINLGNTCYVNSVLQGLYQCDLFRKYILEHYFTEEIVLKELQILFAQLNLSKRPYINAINLVKIARPSWFILNEQQDCAEFLGYLIDTIKDEEKKDKNLLIYEIERLFTIRTCQINRCQKCFIESYREESSNYLFLPIPTPNNSSVSEDDNNSLNLQFVFDCYFQKEELRDENQYRCEHCRSLQNAERYIILKTSPEYLILSLNRFEYEKKTNIFRKVFTKITYPKVLNVQINPNDNSKKNSILTKYCLVLIIVHTGYTLHGGHYYVYAREIKPLLSKIKFDEQEDYFTNDEWFLLNDEIVTLSSYESMIENCAQYTSATPYVLIYKRIDQKRIEDMEKTKQIHIHQNLIEQINEDNRIYEHEQQK